MGKRISLVKTILLLSTSIVTFFSCEKDDIPLEAASIERVSGNEQAADVLESLKNPLVLLVKDQHGKALPGAIVRFTVNEGSVNKETDTTDQNGNASVLWTLGGTIGSQTLEATVDGLPGASVIFSATGNQITVTDIDGNTYHAVVIGDQVWMAENLKSKHFANGDEIPASGWFAYDNDLNNAATYGLLYNWYTVDDSRNVCPDGWHVPTDDEFIILNSAVSGNAGNLRETGTSHWSVTNSWVTNQSGFTALPGGYWSRYFGFQGMGEECYLGSASERGDDGAFCIYINSTLFRISGHSTEKNAGVSVRCLRD